MIYICKYKIHALLRNRPACDNIKIFYIKSENCICVITRGNIELVLYKNIIIIRFYFPAEIFNNETKKINYFFEHATIIFK